MNSGIVSVEKVINLAFDQVAQPDEVMSIFAGGVFWESKQQFEERCLTGGEHAVGRLLEIRVYDQEREFHATRDSIDPSRELSWRTACDGDYEGFVDDTQYLDVDSQRSDASNCLYRATGGGEYTLPVANAERIKLRNYIEYDDNGIAHFVDFRIVGLLKEGE